MSRMMSLMAFAAPRDDVSAVLAGHVLDHQPAFSRRPAQLYAPRADLTIAVLDPSFFEHVFDHREFIHMIAEDIVVGICREVGCAGYLVSLADGAAQEGRVLAFDEHGEARWEDTQSDDANALQPIRAFEQEVRLAVVDAAGNCIHAEAGNAVTVTLSGNSEPAAAPDVGAVVDWEARARNATTEHERTMAVFEALRAGVATLDLGTAGPVAPEAAPDAAAPEAAPDDPMLEQRVKSIAGNAAAKLRLSAGRKSRK